MLGLVLSLVVSTASAMPSAAVTCPGWPATCDGAAVPPVAPSEAGDEHSDDRDADGHPEYATPAEIDCPAPLAANGPIASGECDGAPLDLWYRVSRLPESERPAGSLMPTSRRSRAAHGSASGGGPADPGQLSAPSNRRRSSRCTTSWPRSAVVSSSDRRTRSPPAWWRRPIARPGPDPPRGLWVHAGSGQGRAPERAWFLFARQVSNLKMESDHE
jgi:hypothetical protein